MWKKPMVNALLQHPIICQKKRSGASSRHGMSFWFVLMEYGWRERGRHRIKAPVSDGSSPGLQSVVIWWGLYLTPSCEIKAPPPESFVQSGCVHALSTGSRELLWCVTVSPDESRPSANASLEVDTLLPFCQDCCRNPTRFDESFIKPKLRA